MRAGCLSSHSASALCFEAKSREPAWAAACSSAVLHGITLWAHPACRVHLAYCSLCVCPCRRYYIEAEEVEWNYAPLGGDFCSGELLSWTPDQAVFTVPNHLSLGSKCAGAGRGRGCQA